MIVRTYQRRSRNIPRTSFTVSDCEEETSSQEYLGFSSLGSSSQDSSSWHYNNNQEAKQKARLPGGLCPPTSTLMEAQESGELMEHVDEANFALDGLKPEQPLRIQRSSLVALLSICTSAQQRRLLRTQGMVKPVLDAILALSTDDPPTALAAAALLYILASDGQDEHLLDSAVCIQFLLKLLSPSFPEASEKKASLGSKLLGVTADSSLLRVPASGVDRGGVAITMKVRKLLSSMREIDFGSSEQDEDRDCFPCQELNSKWLSLLTLEKACLSTVALEDTSGSVRRVGGNFKERLRELGGLDAVCNIAVNCFNFLKEVLEDHFMDAALKSTKTSELLESVRMLLKSMKVIENATFLSELNQKYLLEMTLKLKNKGLELSFITLVISVVKTLSELLVKHKSQSSVYGSHISKCCTKTVKRLQISSTVTGLDEDLKENKKVPSVASAPNGGRGRRKTGKVSNLEDNTVISTEKIPSTSVSSSKFSIAGSDNSCALAGEMLHKNGFNNAILGTSSKKRLAASSTGNAQARNAGNSSADIKSFTGQVQRSVKSADQRRNACSEGSLDPFGFVDEELASMNKVSKVLICVLYKVLKMAALRVQSIAGSGLVSLPPHFIRPIHERPSVNKELGDSAQVPLIDLSNLGKDAPAHLREKTIAEIGSAAQEWGLFQMANHGVSEQLIKRLQAVGKEFFDLPQEEKERYANEAESGMIEGYGTKLAHSIDGKLGWTDYFFHTLWPPSSRNIQNWPKRPSSYVEVNKEYTRALLGVVEKLLSALSIHLKVDECRLKAVLGGDDMVMEMKINYYPPCPQPELVVGVPPHTDMSALTLLIPNEVPGLQLHKDGCWFDVDYIPNAIIVHIGDQLEILSNGKYKSVLHRSVVSKDKLRMSWPVFCAPPADKVIGPMKELINEHNPPLFNAETYREFKHRKLNKLGK